MLLTPATGVGEGFEPRRTLGLGAGIVGILPGEEGTLQVGHHGQMATVRGADAGGGEVGAVGAAGVLVVGVAEDDVVIGLGAGEGELALAVGHPDAEFAAGERTEHHAGVLGDGDAEELRLKLVRSVVEHLGFGLAGGGAYQSEFHHQLAAVADTEGEGVGAAVEAVEGGLGFRVVEEGAGPALGRAEDVGVGEAAAEDYHLYVVQRFAARGEVGHGYVLHVEAGQMEGIGHLPLAIGALLADDGGTHAALGAAVGVGPEVGQTAGEGSGQAVLQGLLLIVLVALVSLPIEGLLAVEEPRGFVPHVAETL